MIITINNYLLQKRQAVGYKARRCSLWEQLRSLLPQGAYLQSPLQSPLQSINHKDPHKTP